MEVEIDCWTPHPPVADRADEGVLGAGLMKEMGVKTVRNKQVALEKRQLGKKEAADGQKTQNLLKLNGTKAQKED